MFDSLKDSLKTCEAADLKAAVGQLHGLQCATHAALLDVIAEMDSREAHRSDGACSMASWLSLTLGIGARTAAEWVRVASALTELPQLAQAYREGRICWDKLREVTRIATPEDEGSLLDDALRISVDSLALVVRRKTRVTVAEAEQRHRSRQLVIRSDPSRGWVRFWGRLPDVDGAIFKSAIEKLADAAPKDPDTDLYPPYERRCADALVSLASRYLGGEQAKGCARATIVVHADAEVLQGKEGTAELEDGTVLAPETVALVCCDADIELSFDGRDGKPVGVGRKFRRPTAWLARQVRKRDICCRFPGCARMRMTTAHHMDHWVRDLGPTDLDNLALLCPYHHRLMHVGGWNMRGDPNGELEFIRRDGKVLVSRPPSLRPDVRDRILQPVLAGLVEDR